MQEDKGISWKISFIIIGLISLALFALAIIGDFINIGRFLRFVSTKDFLWLMVKIFALIIVIAGILVVYIFSRNKVKTGLKTKRVDKDNRSFGKTLFVVISMLCLLLFTIAIVLNFINVGIILITLGILFLVIGGFTLQALKKIPAEPPTIAVVTFLGERTLKNGKPATKKEGWRLFWLYPWLYGYIPVDVTKVDQDLKPQDVRTSGDKAEISITTKLTWKPDKENLIQYLNSGGKKNIMDILEDIVAEAVRELATNPNKEPKTWEEAVAMKRIFLAEIVSVILGKDPSLISPAEIEKIAMNLRRGNGNQKIESLGIILDRVNVTEVKPKNPKLADAADETAIEKRQKESEKIEIQTVKDLAKELVDTLKINPKTALEVIQTERKKVTKSIQEHKYDVAGVPPELMSVVLGIIKRFSGSTKK